MKRKSRIFTAITASILAIGVVSCAPEEQEQAAADYTGTWTCSETTSNPAGTSSYSVVLKKSGTSGTDYKIGNFYNLGTGYEATVSIGATTIAIPSQTIGSGNNTYSASGSGTVNSATKLTMSYNMDDGSGAIDRCSSTFTKQ